MVGNTRSDESFIVCGRAGCAEVFVGPRGVFRVALLNASVCFVNEQVSNARFASVAKKVQAILNGDNVPPDLSIDIRSGTAFQREVWSAILHIPFGRTLSYSELAKNIGRPSAVRAVGVACGANPLPLIIPCHRVVKTDGTSGGFSAGVKWKRKLLAMEGFFGLQNNG